MTMLVLVLFFISMAVFVVAAGVSITAEWDLKDRRFGVFLTIFVVAIIGIIACYCLRFSVIGDSTTDVLSTEERVELSEDSSPEYWLNLQDGNN